MHEFEDVQHDFDWERAVEWSIEDAMNRGCTCKSEPDVKLVNCEVHGVHLSHSHEKECILSMIAERQNQIMQAPWN